MDRVRVRRALPGLGDVPCAGPALRSSRDHLAFAPTVADRDEAERVRPVTPSVVVFVGSDPRRWAPLAGVDHQLTRWR